MSSSPEQAPAPSPASKSETVEVSKDDLDLILFCLSGISQAMTEEHEGHSNWRYQWSEDTLDAYDRLFKAATT